MLFLELRESILLRGVSLSRYSEANVTDQPVDEAVVAVWNERIANKLENAGKRNPDVSLQSVRIDESALHFLWRVEPPRSKGA